MINETHQGHRVIKLFGGQQHSANKFNQVNTLIVQLGKKKISQADAARSPISEVVGSTALAVVIFFCLMAKSARYDDHWRIHGIYCGNDANVWSY